MAQRSSSFWRRALPLAGYVTLLTCAFTAAFLATLGLMLGQAFSAQCYGVASLVASLFAVAIALRAITDGDQDQERERERREAELEEQVRLACFQLYLEEQYQDWMAAMLRRTREAGQA